MMNTESTQTGTSVKSGVVLAAGIVAVAMMVLAGCNTTEGIGKDLKSVGKGIEETAQDAKD